MDENIIKDYTQRVTNAQQQADKYKKLANTYSLLRLVVFALLVLALYFAIKQDDFTVLAIAFIISLFCFAWLVSRQSVFEKQKRYFLDLKTVNGNEIESILNYSNIYDNGIRFADDKHFYSADLDVFGNASLYQLLNRAATPIGNEKLAGWLSAPAAKGIILSRQEAIKELSDKNDWKPEIQALLLFANKAGTDQLQNLFKYLHIPLDLPGEKWLNIYAKIAPYLLALLIIAGYFFPAINTVAVLAGLFNLGIVSSKASYIKKADLIAGKIGDTLNNYAIVFEKIEKESWASGYCKKLAERLATGNTSAQIKELSGLINKLNYHLNLIVAFVLNVFFLWDIRQIIAIENWKRNNDKNLEGAFDVIAGYEALVSLASLHINYPEWCFPEIADGPAYTLTAKGLAHPLISQAKRIENDYELDSAFNIDIITGSNMAGKSTFLRTAGINTVLALCGGPVCAQYMKVSVMTILSYMRIKDSLNESTSTFKAELDRLQMLLKAVESDTKIFFLIDEMLRGTNSVDKYLGSKAVIERLISKKAVGMVATHDLQIAELEKKYPAYIRNFYFDIQVVNGEMLFDYKMKHGECKTFNASLLLKQIGIDVEAE
ncbi:MutS-related protein [Mucilaginibacter sp.]|uniref:MutS-related protein n=1 Tax=Mucilaginibacter sp. TaxID=1882438 RepID=UPI002841AE73|nr:DNA mismatch repair protein MutS [Mucilaginibacter sp.]MDR3694343.1 DNA mismatch repair protein MutS [Mucilaginibacter sp.]